MTILNATGVQVCQVQNQLVPDEGPKSIPLDLDFTTEIQFLYDATIQQNLGYLSMIQTLWIDTVDMGDVLYVVMPGSRQRLSIPMGTQGYYNVLCPNPAKVQFTSSLGAGSAKVQLINVPIAAIVYSGV